MSIPRPTIAGCPRVGAGLVLFARGVATGMTGNPYFPSPPVPMVQFSQDINALDLLEQEGGGRGVKATSKCAKARTAILQSLSHLRDYVAQVSENDLDHALEIILSSGFPPRKPAKRNKVPLRAIRGKNSGEAIAIAFKVPKAILFYWQISADGGQTWKDLPDTPGCRTTVSGLIPRTEYMFRVRARTRAGMGEYIGPASVVVL